MSCLDITGYYQNQSIFLPIYWYLRSIQVDYQFDATASDVELCSRDKHRVAKKIKVAHHGFCTYKNLGSRDIVIIAPGSSTSESLAGSSHRAPASRHSGDLTELLDESWSLWLELSNKYGGFGDPYNFCTRRAESILGSFTITTTDFTFFRHIQSLSQCDCDSTAGTFIALQESQWKINLCLPIQPVFSDQPKNVLVLWGFATLPIHKGDYVHKSMLQCSGTEVLTEVLGHLHLRLAPGQSTILIPRVMPRMTASLLTRTPGDRPETIPKETCNIGIVGQFVEFPHISSVDVSYGVRTAKVVVSRLMGLETGEAGQRPPVTASCTRVLLSR